MATLCAINLNYIRRIGTNIIGNRLKGIHSFDAEPDKDSERSRNFNPLQRFAFCGVTLSIIHPTFTSPSEVITPDLLIYYSFLQNSLQPLG